MDSSLKIHTSPSIAFSIWIIGLSSAGKSTIANLLVRRIRENGYPCMLLDGDQIRDIFPERLGYEQEARRKQTERVLRLVKWVSEQGILPIIAIIHPFEDDRQRCRESLDGYFELYLKCDLKTCMDRDIKIQKHVYPWNEEEQHVLHNIVGVDIPFDEPLTPDLVLESDQLSADEILEILWERTQAEIMPNYKLRVANV